MNIILKIGLSLALFSLFACESMEDTYKQWAGDGKIRYVGVCDSIEVEAGWKRFRFTWKSSADPLITHFKINWNGEDGKSGNYLIPVGQNSFVTPPEFDDFVYTFDFHGAIIDDAGNETLSLPVTEYARPFSATHGLVIGFPKGITKYYFIGNNLVLFLDDYMEGFEKISLNYLQEGVSQEVDILSKIKNGIKYHVVNGVDNSTIPTIERIATVEGSFDEITFDSYRLDRDRFNPNYDFIQQVTAKYNLKELTLEWATEQRSLELNYSITSLEDILYFPNLQEIILGGSRYMVTVPGWSNFLSTLTSKENSIFALQTMHNILGIDVTVYNNHYGLQGDSRIDAFAQYEDNPTLPSLNYLNTSGWTSIYYVNDTEESALLPYLLDNNPETAWLPMLAYDNGREHRVEFDMLSTQTITGVKISQYNATDSDQSPTLQFTGFYPDLIKIQVSDNGKNWEDAFYYIQATLGRNPSESTVLYFPQPHNVRYIRFVVQDRTFIFNTTTIRNVSLGDFMVFGN